MEPVTAVVVIASLTAITSAVVSTVADLKKVRRGAVKQTLRKNQVKEARLLLKFEVDGKEVEVEYDSDKLSPEEVNRIVENLKSASR